MKNRKMLAFPGHKTVQIQIAGAQRKYQGQTYPQNTADN